MRNELLCYVMVSPFICKDTFNICTLKELNVQNELIVYTCVSQLLIEVRLLKLQLSFSFNTIKAQLSITDNTIIAQFNITDIFVGNTSGNFMAQSQLNV